MKMYYQNIKIHILQCMIICFIIMGESSSSKAAAVAVGMNSDHADSLLYDLDAEQSQAKYDPRILTKEFQDKIISTERAASCITDNIKYDHGQKVDRSDPCEVCLCVDGEVFCWWKKCDIQKRKLVPKKGKHRKLKKTIKKLPNFNTKHPQFPFHHHNKSKSTKNLNKKMQRFPEHLPATLHYEFFNDNQKSEILQIDHHQNENLTTINPNSQHKTSQFIDNNYLLKTMTKNNQKPFATINTAFIINNRNNNNNKNISSLPNSNNNLENIQLPSVAVPAAIQGVEGVGIVGGQQSSSSAGALLKNNNISPPLIDKNQHNGENTVVTQQSNIISNNKCIVMGISYEIGSILPQETGNCLQCICTKDDLLLQEEIAPKITCNPHNCPPIILPDLFDATGY